MVGLKSCAHLGFLFLISSHWLHFSSAQNLNNNHLPSTNPNEDVSKPGWTWPLPVPPIAGLPNPNPEIHRGHQSHHGGGGGGGGGGGIGVGGRAAECNCHCNCDCEKTQCKSNAGVGGGPVVCLPMTCDGMNGCKVGGGISNEGANSFQIPHFTVAGVGSNGQSTSPVDINVTDAGRH